MMSARKHIYDNRDGGRQSSGLSSGEAAKQRVSPRDTASTAAPFARDEQAVEEALSDLDAAQAIIEEELVELDELGLAQAEAEELRDKFIRLQAEWDNFRKRTAAERTAERCRATERLIEKLLPVVDDLERAIGHSDNASEGSLREGITAVYAKLNEVLTREGVKVIDPQSQPFDAIQHQAVGKVEDASVPDETVAQVYQKGYELGERILRPAMVVVSTGGPRPSEGSGQGGAD
jgi:molecular chaperone GrpE